MDSCEKCNEIVENEVKLLDFQDGDKLYSIGLQDIQKLLIKKDHTVFVELHNDVCSLLIQYGNETNEIIVRNGVTGEVLDAMSITQNVLDLNNKGNKWDENVNDEGLYCYGSKFDSSGNITYSGFLYKGKKYGYGKDFYPNISILEYEGTFLNDLRHGWGSLYDKMGNRVYEGEWILGQNKSFSVTIPGNFEDHSVIHNCIEELIIGENCYNSLQKVQIVNYDILRLVKIGDNCFQNASEFVIRHCNSLKTVECGIACFTTRRKECDLSNGVFSIFSCSQLKSVYLGSGSFNQYGKYFELKGNDL